MSIPETVAVILALAYVILAIVESRFCWLAGGVSALLYIVIFTDARLYMEAGLQGVYIAMAVYGWFTWGAHPAADSLPIRRWSIRRHALLAIAVMAASLALGEILSRFTDAAWPVVDSFTTLAALVATYMVTQKILENWLWWIIIDAISIGLYLSRDLHLTALLFCGYVVLATAGWIAWHKKYSAIES